MVVTPVLVEALDRWSQGLLCLVPVPAILLRPVHRQMADIAASFMRTAKHYSAGRGIATEIKYGIVSGSLDLILGFFSGSDAKHHISFKSGCSVGWVQGMPSQQSPIRRGVLSPDFRMIPIIGLWQRSQSLSWFPAFLAIGFFMPPHQFTTGSAVNFSCQTDIRKLSVENSQDQRDERIIIHLKNRKHVACW